MMKISVVLVGLLLTGCASDVFKSDEQMASADDKYCKDIKATGQTYPQCRIFLSERRRDQRNRIADGIAAAGDSMQRGMQSNRSPVNCSSYRTGSYVHTNCY